MIKGNLLYSKPSHLNANLILKITSSQQHSLVFDQIFEYYGLVKLTNKINPCQEGRSEVIIKNALT